MNWLVFKRLDILQLVRRVLQQHRGNVWRKVWRRFLPFCRGPIIPAAVHWRRTSSTTALGDVDVLAAVATTTNNESAENNDNLHEPASKHHQHHDADDSVVVSVSVHRDDNSVQATDVVGVAPSVHMAADNESKNDQNGKYHEDSTSPFSCPAFVDEESRSLDVITSLECVQSVQFTESGEKDQEAPVVAAAETGARDAYRFLREENPSSEAASILSNKGPVSAGFVGVDVDEQASRDSLSLDDKENDDIEGDIVFVTIDRT